MAVKTTLTSLPLISPPCDFLNQFFFQKIPWVLWKGALALGRGTTTAMAIMTCTLLSDHQNYVWAHQKLV
jgi:hypothetical protein